MNKKPIFFEDNWASRTAQLLQSEVEDVHLSKNKCSVMLTGGVSAKMLYLAWAELSSFARSKRIDFYLGDERYLPINDSGSNCGMVLRTLLKNKSINHVMYPMRVDLLSHIEVADDYNSILPKKIDILILTAGDDGHIASLFIDSPALHERGRSVVAVNSPKPPFLRITITPEVIMNAMKVYVLAPGVKKALVYKRALESPSKYKEFPVRLVIEKAVWLLDTRV
jgi:6-phosphogluconolactonase